MALAHSGLVLSPLTASFSSSSSSSPFSCSPFPSPLFASPSLPTLRRCRQAAFALENPKGGGGGFGDAAASALGRIRSNLSSAFFSSLDSGACISLPPTDTDTDTDPDEVEEVGVSRTNKEPAARDDERNPQVAINLLGFQKFVRQNPKSDRFGVIRFHHVEFWCGDASNTYRRFSWGLGMNLVAKSDQTTGNQTYCSYVIQSNQLVFAFTAPLSSKIDQTDTRMPHPGFDSEEARLFFSKHGLAVRAVGLLVEDAEEAFNTSVANGAIPVFKPHVLTDTSSSLGGALTLAEVRLYGDVVLRYISNYKKEEGGVFRGPFLPNYEPVVTPPITYGLMRLDHAVGNVYDLLAAVKLVTGFTGFHEFAEFTADDVGTAESGLNSMVLANNTETVLLPLNEPVYGTKRKSQIQTYLEHNEGPGLQHLALLSNDIFATLKEMRSRTELGGFDFMPKPPPTYYANLRNRVADVLTETQMQECDELGILVDRDDQGVLLQIFTKPIGDRPTIFIEIIQRIGCMEVDKDGKKYQKGGCGGFGKGNFSELFKSIEEYEKTLDGSSKAQ